MCIRYVYIQVSYCTCSEMLFTLWIFISNLKVFPVGRWASLCCLIQQRHTHIVQRKRRLSLSLPGKRVMLDLISVLHAQDVSLWCFTGAFRWHRHQRVPRSEGEYHFSRLLCQSGAAGCEPTCSHCFCLSLSVAAAAAAARFTLL